MPSIAAVALEAGTSGVMSPRSRTSSLFDGVRTLMRVPTSHDTARAVREAADVRMTVAADAARAWREAQAADTEVEVPNVLTWVTCTDSEGVHVCHLRR